ncbi:unnamed protein product [Withania somnifera]
MICTNFKVPISLSNCKSLLIFDIGGNKINGTIPKWFGERLLSLQMLSMTDNKIDGHIPPQLCQLRLQILDLSHSNLIGSIPSRLGSLRGLKSVKLYKWHPNYYYFNYVFTPKMELIIGLSALGTLNLSWNQLSGRIPEDIGGMRLLEKLDLSSNHPSCLSH